jgi:hypothetical protein
MKATLGKGTPPLVPVGYGTKPQPAAPSGQSGRSGPARRLVSARHSWPGWHCARPARRGGRAAAGPRRPLVKGCQLSELRTHDGADRADADGAGGQGACRRCGGDVNGTGEWDRCRWACPPPWGSGYAEHRAPPSPSRLWDEIPISPEAVTHLRHAWRPRWLTRIAPTDRANAEAGRRHGAASSCDRQPSDGRRQPSVRVRAPARRPGTAPEKRPPRPRHRQSACQSRPSASARRPVGPLRQR